MTQTTEPIAAPSINQDALPDELVLLRVPNYAGQAQDDFLLVRLGLDEVRRYLLLIETLVGLKEDLRLGVTGLTCAHHNAIWLPYKQAWWTVLDEAILGDNDAMELGPESTPEQRFMLAATNIIEAQVDHAFLGRVPLPGMDLDEHRTTGTEARVYPDSVSWFSTTKHGGDELFSVHLRTIDLQMLLARQTQDPREAEAMLLVVADGDPPLAVQALSGISADVLQHFSPETFGRLCQSSSSELRRAALFAVGHLASAAQRVTGAAAQAGGPDNGALILSGDSADAVIEEQAGPAADTPERRATFGRVDRLAARISDRPTRRGGLR